MKRKDRGQLYAASSVAALSAVLLAFPQTARAATAGNLNFVSAVDINSYCSVTYTADVSGTIDDGSGNDVYSYGMVTTSQTWSTVQILTTVANGASTSATLTFNNAGFAPRNDWVFSIFDRTANDPPPGTFLAGSPVPRAALVAAGGNCRNIVSNSPPVADAGADQTVSTGGAAVTLDGSGSSDPDGDPITYFWTQVSGPSVFLTGGSTASPTFTAPAQTNQPQQMVFQLLARDGIDPTGSVDTVTVTLAAGPNAAPVANAGPDATVAGGASVSLSGSASDADGDPLTYQWSQSGGPSVTLANATTLTPSFTAPPKSGSPQVLSFTLIANDGSDPSAPDTVDITVAANVGPAANAGPDQLVGGNAAVTLDGSGSSDGDGDPLTYQWVQISGPSVTLSGASTASPSFSAPPAAQSAQTLEFQLTTSDGLQSATDTIQVTVSPNLPPVVDAGISQTVAGSSAVTLNGTASDPENDPMIFQWTQTGGPPVSLTGATSLSAGFTAPPKTSAPQQLTFELTVQDGPGNIATDTVQITIAANTGPTANAGADQTVGANSLAALDGSASSDPENDPLTYQWVQISGPSVAITNATSAAASFTTPPPGQSNQILEFELTVSDGITSSTDAVQFTVLPNGAPTVSAGTDQTVAGDATVSLTGTASDPESDPLTFQWSQTAGPAVTLTGGTTLNAGFTAPPKAAVDQTLSFELVATDTASNSATDTVDITVAANLGPVANAGADQNVTGGQNVTLSASGSSDGDGDTLSYRWTQTGGPNVTLAGDTTATASFTAPLGGSGTQVLTFELEVWDPLNSGSPVTDTVEITVQPNSAPVADAGDDFGPVDSGQTATLDGTGSSDPDNDTLTYSWTQVSGTAVTLNGADTAAPSFTAPLVNGTEDLIFELIVSDGQVDSAPDRVTVSIRAIGSIRIIQKVVGADTGFAFTSDVTALNGTIQTVGGTGMIAATEVSAGGHTITAADLSTAGYAITDITCNDSDSAVDVAARRVDAELSPNEELVCTFTSTNTRAAALEAIEDFLTGRNALIMTNQPDSQRRIDRLQANPGSAGSASAYGVPVLGSGHLPANLMLSAGGVRAHTSLGTVAAAAGDPDRGSQAFDIWTEAYFAWSRIGAQEGQFSIVHAGADYRVSPDILLGVMASFDDFSNDGPLDTGEAEGAGWMAGPYVTARLAPQLYGELRAAWGRSNNRVNPLGTYVDAFETTRSYYSGSLIGQFDIDSATTFRPEVSIRYLSENQEAYLDSYDIAIPSQVVGQGEVAFSPRLHRVFALQDGWQLRPFGEVEGIYTFGAGGSAVIGNGLRARAKLGVDLMGEKVSASLAGFHDGIGTSGLRSTGIYVSISFGF